MRLSGMVCEDVSSQVLMLHRECREEIVAQNGTATLVCWIKWAGCLQAAARERRLDETGAL
jgi:hypothetical protein